MMWNFKNAVALWYVWHDFVLFKRYNTIVLGHVALVHSQ